MQKDEFLEFMAERGVSPQGAETAWELCGEDLAGMPAEDFDAALDVAVATVRLESGL